MHTISIQSFTDSLYKDFEELYKVSFPIFEQRTTRQQAEAFASKAYHLTVYLEDGKFRGFISYWEFDEYIYIEHLAVHTSCRGKGYGSRMLKHFVGCSGKQVLLEIDPVVDEVSAARLRFYQQCGFCKNEYQHIHPPYRQEYAGHSLIILSSKDSLPEERFQMFQHDLKHKVMGSKHSEQTGILKT